jgi:hypothetical protein
VLGGFAAVVLTCVSDVYQRLKSQGGKEIHDKKQ